MRMESTANSDLELQIEFLLEMNENLILATQNMRTQLMGLRAPGLGRAKPPITRLMQLPVPTEGEFNRLYPDSIW